jgi:phosphatidate cytidylyltransferase
VFAAALIVVALLGMHELYRMTGRAGRLQAAGYVATAALIAAALFGGPREMVLALVATVPLCLALGLATRKPTAVTRSVAITALGVAWIALGLAHGVLLRELPHGTALVIDVLLATFLGDTGAHLIGAAFGRRKLAPRVSPSKTVEGLVAGIVVGTLAVLVAALLFQPWLEPWQALVLGFAAAVAAPCGDLFESLLKRDLGVKDTGTLFGAHGGVLDRIDAVVFAAVAGYYVSVLLL